MFFILIVAPTADRSYTRRHVVRNSRVFDTVNGKALHAQFQVAFALFACDAWTHCVPDCTTAELSIIPIVASVRGDTLPIQNRIFGANYPVNEFRHNNTAMPEKNRTRFLYVTYRLESAGGGPIARAPFQFS